MNRVILSLEKMLYDIVNSILGKISCAAARSGYAPLFSGSPVTLLRETHRMKRREILPPILKEVSDINRFQNSCGVNAAMNDDCRRPCCRPCGCDIFTLIGPTGPTGPTGATGATGATGPTGKVKMR